jgi:hypothetical protein
VAFESDAKNLVSGDANNVRDVSCTIASAGRPSA